MLKPSGVLGVEEHRAAPGTPLDRIIASGYVPEAYVIEHARAAGFELARCGAVDRERFTAIGESDRVALVFVKPRR